MNDQSTHRVFISYATPDRDRVIPYYNWLRERGLDAWIDCRSIRPGQNWDFEIKRALDKSSFVVAFISSNSYNRRGYVQRELKIALDNLLEKLVDDIYIVTVILDDDVGIPEQLKGIQCISGSDVQCKEKISDAITYQLGRLGVQVDQTQRKQDIYWTSKTLRESWDGLPGYEFEAQLLSFTSDTYPNAYQIGDYLQGRMLDQLFRHRLNKLSQISDFYNYGQEKFSRTNTYDAHCGTPKLKGRVISVQYAVHWYGAGAAHSNFHFETHVFSLDPRARRPTLESMFSEPSKALSIIQDAIRKQLKSELPLKTEANHNFGTDWIERGTDKWEDFSAFVLAEDSIDLMFAPYQVASYAEGAKF
ncbi:TIR domain-containing protein, partial [Thiomonas sp. SCN 64-16]|uniref:TIR domain-containing protein n=1 Tax=Thiomonas sp. SCN 64-16 TaxID=1660151 RepID=UPI0025807BA5